MRVTAGSNGKDISVNSTANVKWGGEVIRWEIEIEVKNRWNPPSCARRQSVAKLKRSRFLEQTVIVLYVLSIWATGGQPIMDSDKDGTKMLLPLTCFIGRAATLGGGGSCAIRLVQYAELKDGSFSDFS
ncbi:hypothetical protein BJ912DRAFT_926154 [Pholiota molesta]|nr:hypothetical protein BJ912DRAFT_926154 [Pholiota molesta]